MRRFVTCGDVRRHRAGIAKAGRGSPLPARACLANRRVLIRHDGAHGVTRPTHPPFRPDAFSALLAFFRGHQFPN